MEPGDARSVQPQGWRWGKIVRVCGGCTVLSAALLFVASLVDPASRADLTREAIDVHVPLDFEEAPMDSLEQLRAYPHPRRPLPLTAIGLNGKHLTRHNSVSGKPERLYNFAVRQSRMTIYTQMEQGRTMPNVAKSSPILRYYLDHGAQDMFIATRFYDISQLPPSQIVEFHPKVTRHKGITFDNSIVHHMDLFLCTAEAQQYPTETIETPSMGGDTACDAMPWAYDRDGKALVLPDHVGVSIGKGTPYTRLAFEWHYLLNKDGDLFNVYKDFTDHSGVDLVLTPDIRQHSTSTFGMMNMDMALPPGREHFEYVMTTAKNKVGSLLQHDFKMYNTLKPIAVHLHMHNHGRKARWDHLREGHKIGEFGRIDQYKGWGTDQSFFMIADKGVRNQKQTRQEAKRGHFDWKGENTELKEGDSLRMHCVFDTRCKYATPLHDPNCEKASAPIDYGLSHGKEMCGFLMMYYPHDPSVRMANGMLLGDNDGDLIPLK